MYTEYALSQDSKFLFSYAFSGISERLGVGVSTKKFQAMRHVLVDGNPQAVVIGISAAVDLIDGGIEPQLHKPRVRFFALGIKTLTAHNRETIGLGQRT